MKDLNLEERARPDPSKVFKIIADIISDREGIKVSLKKVKAKREQQTA
jgi:hypothetical protein